MVSLPSGARNCASGSALGWFRKTRSAPTTNTAVKAKARSTFRSIPLVRCQRYLNFAVALSDFGAVVPALLLGGLSLWRDDERVGDVHDAAGHAEVRVV